MTWPQRMLDAQGPAAAQIAQLWWLILGMAVLTAIVLPALLLFAVRRGRRRADDESVPGINGGRLVWIGGVIVPATMLFTALVASYRLSPEIYPPRELPADAVTIDIVAHMFWWQVVYPEHGIETANEFVIPARTPVRLRLTSGDVIHSFWVPQLHGKLDHVPGRRNELWIRADTTGRFRGQCAEYCGLSHALMALWLTAVEPDEFDAWLARRTQPAAPESAAEGRRVFERAGCGQCHGVPGAPLPPVLTGAGPDLGDFGDRRTLGAGRLPNTRSNLAVWIANPQRLKPGVRMPGTTMTERDMDALVDYLFSLR